MFGKDGGFLSYLLGGMTSLLRSTPNKGISRTAANRKSPKEPCKKKRKRQIVRKTKQDQAKRRRLNNRKKRRVKKG